jgi:hypothetical protein
MSAGLTIDVKLAESATALLQRVEAFNRENPEFPEDWNLRAHVGINPMLLALSMELALKAWYVFDHDTSKVWGHDLSKLFEGLKQESQDRLDVEFKRSVAPLHPDFLHGDYGIKSVLGRHKSAFVDWRYTHERKRTSFHESTFVAMLEMVLSEFKKRYRTVVVP